MIVASTMVPARISNPHWKYFAAGEGKVSLISTADLRRYSREAGRPYEAAIDMLIVGQIFATRLNIGYHCETRGCVFDHNANRDDLITLIKSMTIDPHCQNSYTNWRKQMLRWVSSMRCSA